MPRLVSTAAEKDLGPITLELREPAPSVSVAQIPKNKVQGGARCALMAGATVLQSGASGGYAALGALLLTPVAAIGGGVYGAVQGVAERDLREGAAALAAARTDLNFNEVLAAKLLEAAGSAPAGAVELHYVAPAAAGQTVPPANPVQGKPNDPPLDPGQLRQAGAGPGARLQINVYQVGLVGAPATNPPLQLVISLEGDLIRLCDGSSAGKLYLRYGSKPRKYMEWTGNNARVLREEWNRAASDLAERTVAWLTGTLPPPLW